MALVKGHFVDGNDPQLQRVHVLADQAARDLIAAGRPTDDTAYQTLMSVLADPDAVSQPLNPTDGVLAGAAAEPLPLDLAGDAGAAWTDWPPTASTPSLYRPHIDSVATLPTRGVVLQQFADDRRPESVGQATNLKSQRESFVVGSPDDLPR